jgi:hypothetical protein
MMPRRLYKILPYLYILTGIVSAMLIHSRLVIIASMLMIMAGVFVISLRISNRQRPVQRRTNSEGGRIGVHSRRFTKRSAQDRRKTAAIRFPLIDSAGRRIEFDRRMNVNERRVSAF